MPTAHLVSLMAGQPVDTAAAAWCRNPFSQWWPMWPFASESQFLQSTSLHASFLYRVGLRLFFLPMGNNTQATSALLRAGRYWHNEGDWTVTAQSPFSKANVASTSLTLASAGLPGACKASQTALAIPTDDAAPSWHVRYKQRSGAASSHVS